ncbi:HEPN domain-containing protein [Infirmifilum lucidum]|uniref:HEPN domain-containing protein n=1 Tax=Infirmifilum lucidum TaxID=2776706 RepID=A0A7L9FK53_9CREN|nr:HEPN domain-containing protein [Infirmifilum lucidum]QOJ79256.1 HEPN domain-containing protein [Infirmifilum lucidum]
MREEAVRWFEQCLADLSTAEDLLRTAHYYAAAFYSQQAAEKALKALLIASGKAVRTHDLVEMLDIIERELRVSVDEIRADASKLTIHYVVSRYPDAANAVPARIYSREDAEDLLRRASRVVEWVRRHLQ